jgi:hypothetical protein
VEQSKELKDAGVYGFLGEHGRSWMQNYTRSYIYIVWMEYVPDDVNLPTAGHSERERESIMKEWLELSYRTLDSIMHGRSGL